MESIWTILGLEPTKDISAIKRVYAEKAKACHPEEDPQGFLRLRNAYQAALEYAEGETYIPSETLGSSAEVDGEEPEDEGWSISDQTKTLDEGPNPYEDHEAIRNFLDLYTSKQREDPERWRDYFTSDAFLDVAWERRFTALLLEYVTRLETYMGIVKKSLQDLMLEHVIRLEVEYQVNQELLDWLCVAYQFNVIRSVYLNPDGSERVEFQFKIEQEAQFDGQESVFEIAKKGPAPRTFEGVERAMRNSFAEYRYLISLVEKGSWSEEELEKVGSILYHYEISSLADKNPTRLQRHPAGLRLIEHFFRQYDLPKGLYRIVWQRLDLKTALMGRAKLFYGGLRERVLEQVPDIIEGELDILQLNRDLKAYRQSVLALEESGKAGDQDKADEETKAFFARPDFQMALWDYRFAERHMTYNIWWSGSHFIQESRAFYEQHPDAPCAEKLTSIIAKASHKRSVEHWNQEDKTAPIPEGRPSLAYRPFFRHWINTSFYNVRGRASGQELGAYLIQELPYLPEWSREFLEYKEGGGTIFVSVTCTVGEDCVEVRFHLHYMEFLLNHEQVYRPCLPWERVAAVEDTDTFFFLLPITMEVYDQYERVKAEIQRRMEKTAAPEDCGEIIAGYLADYVCRLPLPNAVGLATDFDEDEDEDEDLIEDVESLPPESSLPFEVFAENGDSLYVCVWLQQEQTLNLFQQTPYGRQTVKRGWYDDVADVETAVAMARQILQEQMFPKGFPMKKLKNLPDAVYTQWDYTVVCHDEDPRTHLSVPRELLGEDVTAEIVETLLTQFQENRVQRLELSWKATIPIGEEQGYEPRRSLVFLKDHGKYACLYFDDFKAESYALLEKPELYNEGDERFQSEPVPFLHGKLISLVIHHNFSTIQRHLDVIFSQVNWPNNVKFMAGEIWYYTVESKDSYFMAPHGRVKYNLNKQLLADFPQEWAHNRPDASFYFPCIPNLAVLTDGQGGVETLRIHAGNRFLLQRGMARFFQQGIPKLRMTWGEEQGSRRHIVLLQENGQFLMAWVQEEKKTVQFHVADQRTYMDVEGKKYPKDTFQGRVTPTYLIHNLIPLRNALDLLLANLANPSVITDRIAEYAGEKPVKARSYEELWAELVGDISDGKL